ncbi:MAG: OsmC family protein [Bacteriovoracaceae bacterium]
MKRTAQAHWSGNLKTGKGEISTQSETVKNVSYSFNKRFGTEPGTNPEELIGAAHAGCFAMAFSFELEKAGFTARDIDVEAQVNLENINNNWTVNRVNLVVNAQVPGASEEKIRTAAETAKANCPISRLLNAEITMDLRTGKSMAA